MLKEKYVPPAIDGNLFRITIKTLLRVLLREEGIADANPVTRQVESGLDTRANIVRGGRPRLPRGVGAPFDKLRTSEDVRPPRYAY